MRHELPPQRQALLAAVRLPLAALCLSAPAAAFQFTYRPPYTLQFDHPAGYVANDAKAVVLGQLTDDAIPDACVLHGNEAHLIRATDRRNQWRKLTGTYTAIAHLPEANAADVDRVLALNGNGLVKLVWDSPTQTLVPQAVSGTSAWVNATQLQVHQTPGNLTEILALASNGRYILRASYTPSTAAVSLLTSVPISSSTVITGVEWVSSGNSVLEYAYGGSWGIAVCDVTGTTTYDSISQANNRSLLVRIPMGSSALDRLGWVRAPSGTADFLTVVRPGGVQETAIWLLGTSVAQMVLADLGEDSQDELLLFADAVPYALGLRRDTPASTATFLDIGQPQFIYDIDHGNTLIGQISSYPFVSGTGVLGGTDKAPVPAAMDLDGDGDDDVFAAGHPSGAARAMIFLGGANFEESIDPQTAPVVRAWMPDYTATKLGAQNSMEIVFNLPILPTAGPALTATHVQYTVWVQAAGSSYVDVTPSNVHVLLTDLTPYSASNPPPLLSPLVIGNLNNLGQGWIHIESAFLKMSGGTMVQAFPAYHEKLAISWFANGVPLTFSHGTAGQWVPPYLAGDGGVGGTSGRPPITPPSGGGG
jgi:hypothetical protein